MSNRAAIALGAALFLALAGTGSASAYWGAKATLSATASAGSIGIASTGFPSLSTSYSPSSLAATAPVTVTNTGTIAAPFTLRLAAEAPTPLAAGTRVNTWPVGPDHGCAASSPTPAGATGSDWSAVPDLTATLEPGAETTYCVRTSITSAAQTSLAGTSILGTASVTSSVGPWTASTASTAAQSVADTAPPSAPGTPTASATNATSTTLAWTASTDNVGVVGYDVIRNGTLVATVPTATFTDAALAPGTSFGYAIVARDSTGNASAPSKVGMVTTPPAPVLLDAAKWHRVGASNGCVDSGGTGQSLSVASCGGSVKSDWEFTPVSGAPGHYSVAPRRALSLVWDIALGAGGATANNAAIVLAPRSTGPSQQWRVESASSGAYRFVNRGSGLCLDAQGSQLRQSTCTGAAAQAFTLTEVGG